MKSFLLLLLVIVPSVNASWLEDVDWNTSNSRRAFLLGMGSARGALTGGSGFEGFWPTEQHASDVFFAVAKLHAREIGVSPQMLASGGWKAEVAKSLESRATANSSAADVDIEEAVAFVAGAYVRWGTATGFRTSGFGTGYAIATRISSLNMFAVQLQHQPGFPGNTVITISDGGEASKEEFFRLMETVAKAVSGDLIKTPTEQRHSPSP